MADVYIPKFMNKEMCSHAYLRQTDAWMYILQDIKERFFDSETLKSSEIGLRLNIGGIDIVSTPKNQYRKVEILDNKYLPIPFRVIDLIEDVVETHNLKNNVKLLDNINNIFKNDKETAEFGLSYSIRNLQVYQKYKIQHFSLCN